MLLRPLLLPVLAAVSLLSIAPARAQVTGPSATASTDVTPDMFYTSRTAMIRDLAERVESGDFTGVIHRLDAQGTIRDAQIAQLSETLKTLYDGQVLEHSDILYHKELSDNWQEDTLVYWADGSLGYLYINVVSHTRDEGVLPVLWRLNTDIEAVTPMF